jgi:hypothetical protein
MILRRALITLIILIAVAVPANAQGQSPTPEPIALGGQAKEGALAVSAASPSPTAVATVTGSLVLAVFLVGAGLNGLALLMQATALRSLERSYRRQKNLELEVLQAQVVAQRKAEVARLLEKDPDGWQRVLGQLLADALAGADARIGAGGVLSLSFSPAPRFTVAGVGDYVYVFTTLPDELRRIGILRRREQVVALDASLHPAARIEMQLVWEHLASKRLKGQAPTLPRQAEWFLAVMNDERRTTNDERRLTTND